jgi:hypothetical protein
MVIERNITLLVGDNPFHGISHLSQDRAINRGDEINHVDYAAKLVLTSLANGANGFMFSVSDTTLSILKALYESKRKPKIYAIVPYAYDYVRLTTHLGISGLARKLIKQIILSGNLRAILTGIKGVARMNLEDILETYLLYEISRMKVFTGKKPLLESVLLHEILTDMAVALELDWFFKSYIDFLTKLKIRPGFETRNFAFLVNKLNEWNIDFSKITLLAPFNKIGFQMNPSKIECEKTLASLPETDVIAMSILAAGYLKLPDATDYLRDLPNVKSVVVGVSKERHALETFKFLKEHL